MEPKSPHQKMLHANHHIKQSKGPASNCPYCPKKPGRIVRTILLIAQWAKPG